MIRCGLHEKRHRRSCSFLPAPIHLQLSQLVPSLCTPRAMRTLNPLDSPWAGQILRAQHCVAMTPPLPRFELQPTNRLHGWSPGDQFPGGCRWRAGSPASCLHVSAGRYIPFHIQTITLQAPYAGPCTEVSPTFPYHGILECCALKARGLFTCTPPSPRRPLDALLQVLEEVDVGPIPVGVNKFVLTAGRSKEARHGSLRGPRRPYTQPGGSWRRADASCEQSRRYLWRGFLCHSPPPSCLGPEAALPRPTRDCRAGRGGTGSAVGS